MTRSHPSHPSHASHASHPSRTPERPRTRFGLAVVGGLLVLAGAPAAYATLGGEPTAPETAGGAVSAATVRGKAYRETRLLFGTERPDGGPAVTDAQFRAFVDQEVTPRFPDGLTVQDGRGQWRDRNGTIERERSYELVLLYPQSETGARDPLIERVREAYERAYGQESVGRVDLPVRADF
ncbi:DUF3574 domain-containing protein [Streptomyces tritici]|uniref:DUF3574 domain-containing protein n=1 Tax=Streptomyces tritici TaxID=2054410 RepID=UPI003AF15AAF